MELPGENLTVVIPTFNRPYHLKRSIYYWRQSPFSIIIADGSLEPYPGEIPSNIIYFHDPAIFVIDRWKKAVDMVKTPYMVLCADDDMIGFNAINKCLDFLRNNSDYTSACGRYLTFILTRTIEVEIIYSHLWNVDTSSDDPAVRMQECMNPFMVLIYSVQRTGNFKRAFSSYQFYGNHNISELHINMVTSILGKHKIMPFFYSAREKISGSYGAENKSVIDWIDEGLNRENVLKWKNTVTEIYREATHADAEQAQIAFDMSIESYRIFFRIFREPRFNWKIKLRDFVPEKLVKLRRTILNLDKPKSIEPFSLEALFSADTEIGRSRKKIYAWDDQEIRNDWKLIEKAILLKDAMYKE